MGRGNTEITIMPEEESKDSTEQVLVNLLTQESLRKLFKHPTDRPLSHRPHRTPSPSPNRHKLTSANHLDLPGDDSVHSSRLSIREQLEKSTILDDYAVTPKLCGIIPYPACCQGEPERELPEESRPNPELEEGKTLPNDYEPFPEELCGKPVQEVDPNRTNLKSFVVISKRMGRNTIYRFSATKSLYFLSPLHPLRRGMIYLATNQWFDALVILFILSNCVFLALPKPVEIAEYIFQAFYTIEMIIRILARGFTLEKHTYLRDPWNFLDFFVVIIGYGIIVLERSNNGPTFSFNVSSLRTFRVLRALKTISVIPGLRTIVNALLNSLKMLAEVMVLMVFCLCVASLMGLQLYMGALRSKCVAEGPSNMSRTEFSAHINNASNWVVHVSFDETYQVCGNESYSGKCPSGYTCLAAGENPNWGYTNFDNIGWSLVASFQLITLDYWENVYDLILMAKGPWNVLFFVILVFFGSFYLINLMLAVVTLSYDEESVNVQNEEEEEQKSKKRREKREHDKAVASEAKDPETILNAFEKSPGQAETKTPEEAIRNKVK